jgi:flagellar biosynthetic protein FliQ
MGIGQQALEVTVLVSAPLLLSALVVGLVIGILQAATQINEMTLSFIPKLLVVVLALVVAGPWMLQILTDYTRHLIQSIPLLIG